MKVLNFGSANIDHVYKVRHFAKPGETILCDSLSVFPGGKGLNQSIALGRAGANVSHAGKIGKDGIWLKEILEQSGVDTRLISTGDDKTGHAIIQVTPDGENCIIVHGGENQRIGPKEIENALSHFSKGDLLLLQNETNMTGLIMEKASEMGMLTTLNPSPMTPEMAGLPLHQVKCFILNEGEACELAGEKLPDEAFTSLCLKFPEAVIVMTKGSKGVSARSKDKMFEIPACETKVVDTTAAGDTFTGYFVAEFAAGASVESAARTACKAAAICVSREGAAVSIPTKKDVENF